MRTFRSRRCSGSWLRLFAPSVFIALASSVLCAAIIGASTPACSQDSDVPFSPRKDAEDLTPTKKKDPLKPPNPVQREFSFFRYEGAFRKLCDAVALDGRRERLLEVGREAFAKETECLACKALWRTVIAGCSPRSDRRAPPMRKPKTPQPEESPAATPAQHAAGQRLPSIEVVELASEVSTRIEKDNPGESASLRAMNKVTSQLAGSPLLTPAERDYYEALGEFLRSAWDKR